MVFYPFVAGFLGLGVLSTIFLRLNHTVAWINTSFIRDWFPMAGLQTQQPPGEEHTLLCRLLKLYLPWSVCKGGEALGHIRLNPPQRGCKHQQLSKEPSSCPLKPWTPMAGSHGKWIFPLLDLIFFFEECKGLPCPVFFITEGFEKLWVPRKKIILPPQTCCYD